jgi:hypothetical protein
MTITLIVEDGTGVTSANTYTTVSGANIYFTNYGEDAWVGADGPTDEVKKSALLKAMRYLDNLPWKGYKYSQDQSVSWPRSEVYDKDSRLVSDTSVPSVVVSAQCELALRCLPTSTVKIQPDLARGGKIAAESIGNIARSFQTTAPVRTVITVVDDILAGLLKNRRIVSIDRS